MTKAVGRKVNYGEWNKVAVHLNRTSMSMEQTGYFFQLTLDFLGLFSVYVTVFRKE